MTALATKADLDNPLRVTNDLALRRALMPAGALFETNPRFGPALADRAILTSGREHLVAIALPSGLLVTSITFYSAATAAVAPTNQWFTLRSSARALLRQTVDDLATPWAGGTGVGKTLALSSTFTTTYTGLHYLGIMVAAGTVPSLAGITITATGVTSASPTINGYDATNTGLTTTPPATSAALTVLALTPYAHVN